MTNSIGRSRFTAATVAAGLSLIVSPGFGIAAADTPPGDLGARPATAGTHTDASANSAVSVGVRRTGRARPAAATPPAEASGGVPAVIRLRTPHPPAAPAAATFRGAAAGIPSPGSVVAPPAAAAALNVAFAPSISVPTTVTPTPAKAAAALKLAAVEAPATPAAAVEAVAAHPAAAAVATGVVLPNLTAALNQVIDRLNNLLWGLPGSPFSEGALALVRRSWTHSAGPIPTPSVPSQTFTAVPGLPITVSMVNSFTTIAGTTAAGTVTVNGDTWVADPVTHLYSTTTDLATLWQGYYALMKAGQGASLNNIQRLEGNAEAVFENTGLKYLPAAKLTIDRQDVQRQLDAMYAAMVGAGVDLNKPMTPQQYLAAETVLQGNPTLEELGLQGHGLNNSGITRYAGYTTDFQNNVDQQTLFIGGGLDNNERAIANFFDDVLLSHMPFPTVVRSGVVWQLNQNGNREDTVTDAVAGLNVSMSQTYLSTDFLQPPQLVTKTATQVFTNGQALTLALPAGTFVDPQGQTITYTATLAGGKPLPAWITFDPQTVQFSGTPPAGTTPAAVSVTATNASGLHTTETFGVNFKEPAPLLVIPTPTQTVTPGSAVRITLPTGTFVDPLGESLTYTATLSGGTALPSWLTFDPQTGQLSGQAPAGTKSLSVVVVATNSSGVKTSDKFTIKFS